MRKLFLPLVLILFLFLYLSAPPNVNAQLAITEVFADPQAAQDASEWLEIYNYSPVDIPIDQIEINGKPINSEVEVLLAGQFFTITKNIPAFIAEFGETTQIGQATISLTNTSSTLELKVSGVVSDTITYSGVQQDKSWQLSGFSCSAGVWQNHTNNAANVNYDPDCNILQTEESDLEIVYDLELEQLNFVDPEKKMFAFSSDNYFYFGNNYFPETSSIVIGYYFENHKMIQSKPLVVNAVEQGSSSSSSSSTSSETSSSASSSSESSESSTSSSAQSSQSSSSSSSSSSPASASSSQSSSATSTTTSSTSSQTSFSSQTSSEAIVNYTLEISEMYAAPKSSEKEWLEIYNYGSQNINLAACEIRDNSGKHALSAEISAKAYLQVTDLKISLNNSGELIELYCANNLVNAWLQPATKQGEITARRLGSTRHESEIVFTDTATPGGANQIPQPPAENEEESESESSSSKSNGANSSNKSAGNQANSSGKSTNSQLGIQNVGQDQSNVDLQTKPEFAMIDYTFSNSKTYENEAKGLMAATTLCVLAQFALFGNALSRNTDFKTKIKERIDLLWKKVQKQFAAKKSR